MQQKHHSTYRTHPKLVITEDHLAARIAQQKEGEHDDQDVRAIGQLQAIEMHDAANV